MKKSLKFNSMIVLFILLILALLWSILLRPTTTYTYIQLSGHKHHVNPDWENYISKYDEDAPYDFLTYNKKQILELLGKPLYTLQKEKKCYFSVVTEELLIYMPYISGDNKGPTAIYFNVMNGKITDYRVDDCLGIDHTIIPSYFN